MSENAKAVAKEVSETIRRGKLVDLGKIIRNHGYSKQTSKAPQRVTETKSYKQVMKPIVDQLIKERERIVKELATKELGKERYKDLIDGLDKLTKNIQLLGGKPTEISKIDLSNLSDDELAKLTEESDEGISQEGIGEEKA